MNVKGTFFLGNQRFQTREFALPELGEQDVLIQNKVCGICGTDVHIYYGEPGASDVEPPVVLGHEYSGIVVKTGQAVRNVSVGDHVTVDPNMYCGTCYYCRTGKKNMCTSMAAIGVNFNGGFAEYSVVPAAQCIPVSKDLSFEAAAMSEPLACCIRGIDRAEIKAGMSVCVIGGGPIGLLMVQLAKLAGACAVILSEPVQIRRELGLKLGATYAIDPIAAPIAEQIQALTGRPGVDVVIECVGNSKATEQAFAAADKGATILLFSVSSPDRTYDLNLFDAFRRELTVRTSFVNPDTQQRAVALLNSGKINADALITHRFALEDVEAAIHKQIANDSVKVVVCMDESESG